MRVAVNARHTGVLDETRQPANPSRAGDRFPGIGLRPRSPLLAKADAGARAISIHMVLTYAFVCCAAVGFAAAAVLRHRAYHSAANDLAFFDQIIWNAAHGRFFATSFVPCNVPGAHVQ